ncbi:DNA polymerase lambda (POLL) isoform X1 [Wolffia australiana]
MAPPKRKRAEKTSPPLVDPEGMFKGMTVFLVPKGIQNSRLQIWKHKLLQMGAIIEDKFRTSVTHVLGMNLESILQELDIDKLKNFQGNILPYEWLENSLKFGEKVPESSFSLRVPLSKEIHSEIPTTSMKSGILNNDHPHEDSKLNRINSSMENLNHSFGAHKSAEIAGDRGHELSLLYSPPDLNRNITEIFGRLINVYRALGDDRRSFSYYKAIPVIEKLPFKIESIDQVEHLPGIGKALKDHIQEIVSTGKLSKLEHFEKDEKVRTITLFGEIWGIGPATALKFYEKGHRTLEDLSNEKSLSHAQRLGLQYFDDIRAKIPRKQVSEMEMLLTKTGEDILPGVIIVCGGSYRRGKAFCGDLDIVITHPNGISHKGFLAKYVKYLKDIKFLREDLVFSVHSDEGTDSGVDTYFGLCTEPGQEQRHRIDLKVYPRDIYAFGLIAWTGNDVLNRRLRLLAESKGYRLDDTGLFVATQGSPGKRGMKSSATIHCNSEREVFDFLGFPWLEPHQRNL